LLLNQQSQRNSLHTSTTDTATNTAKDTSGMSDTTGTTDMEGTIDTTTWLKMPSLLKPLK